MRFTVFFCLFLLTACSAPYRDQTVPINAQSDFDPTRYLGRWYEIARFPVFFQEGCTSTTAEYGPVDANTISVINSCRQDSSIGPLRSIHGTADVVGPGQLKVRFGPTPFISAPYWVLWVDDDYETAVVGVPNGRAGWILARTPKIDDTRRILAEDNLRQNGYDPSQLIDVSHESR